MSAEKAEQIRRAIEYKKSQPRRSVEAIGLAGSDHTKIQQKSIRARGRAHEQRYCD